MTTAEIPLRRLQQTTHHFFNTTPPRSNLSVVHGETQPALVPLTLGVLLDEQCSIRGSKECLIVPWTGARWTYRELQKRSKVLAKGILALGVHAGDRIGILASNCEEFVAVFFAAGYLGCILVVLNGTSTASEALYAMKHSGCKLLFVEEEYGRHSNAQLLRETLSGTQEGTQGVTRENRTLHGLKNIVILRGQAPGFPSYDDIVEQGQREIPDDYLEDARLYVNTHDVCNLQFTSGSTGQPKAASLTHFNMINNARSIGSRMAFTPSDILCCPPPLFHCFGLVLGLLVCITHGSSIVLPSATFSAPAVLAALSTEACTALHGVPAMFEELLAQPRPESWACPNLRTGIVAGAPVPTPLMQRMLAELNMHQFTSSYGLTEASPTCFNAHSYDTIQKRLTTVGRVLPHLHAKIVDREGNVVSIGTRGELCMAGYSLQKGYWNNPEKTGEVMVRDEAGILWLHTGDEAVFDVDGYCTITGRFKDIIIRGGENIYPLEIETRLVAHPSSQIDRAAVVGIKHPKYGEVVGAFLLPRSPRPDSTARPTDDDIRVWVRGALGRHKAPSHIFWFGDDKVGMSEIPQTGSGKVKKHLLRDVAERLIDAPTPMSATG